MASVSVLNELKKTQILELLEQGKNFRKFNTNTIKNNNNKNPTNLSTENKIPCGYVNYSWC